MYILVGKNKKTRQFRLIDRATKGIVDMTERELAQQVANKNIEDMSLDPKGGIKKSNGALSRYGFVGEKQVPVVIAVTVNDQNVPTRYQISTSDGVLVEKTREQAVSLIHEYGIANGCIKNINDKMIICPIKGEYTKIKERNAPQPAIPNAAKKPQPAPVKPQPPAAPAVIDRAAEILEGLNPQQLKAATAMKGNIRLVAGAGTGKTNTLTKRIAYIVANGTDPSRILSVTFTNKAAGEMRGRAAELLGVDPKTLYMQTFHSLCSSILREDIGAIGWDCRFNLGTDSVFENIVKDILDANGGNTLNDKTYDNLTKTILRYIGKMRANTEEDYVQYLIDSPMPDLPSLSELVAYEQKKIDDAKQGIKHVLDKNNPSPTNKYVCHVFNYQKKLGYLSFDDLIRVTCYLFRTHPEILKKWQNRYDYVQCDEFQDCDEYQFELLKSLSQAHGNLFVVGDIGQCIYGFRGARPDILTHLDKRLPDVQTIIMDINYRSSGEILNVGNSIIKTCPDRIDIDLKPAKGYSGNKVNLLNFKNAAKSGEGIAASILEHLKKGVSPKDIAILYRASSSKHIPEILTYLRANDVPVVIWDNKDDMKTVEFDMAQRIIELLVNPNNTLAMITLLRNVQGIENLDEVINLIRQLSTAMTSVEAYLKLHKQGIIKVMVPQRIDSLARLFSKYTINHAHTLDIFHADLTSVMNTLAYEDAEGVCLLIQSRIYSFGSTELATSTNFSHVLESILLDNSDKNSQDNPDAVQFMTMHKSKGLEFPVVYCIDVNFKCFPGWRVTDAPEEFRIAYVAYTRARNHLYICTSEENVTKKDLKRPSVVVTQIDPQYLNLPDEISKVWDVIKADNMEQIKDKLYKDTDTGNDDKAS